MKIEKVQRDEFNIFIVLSPEEVNGMINSLEKLEFHYKKDEALWEFWDGIKKAIE